MSALQQFENQQYINIETFRKNGQGVKTPTWFAREGETLFVWTEVASGKVKRIRNNPQISLAPSKGDGTPVGEWVRAAAALDESAEALKHLNHLIQKKYGFAFIVFGLLGRLRGAQYTALKIQVTGG